jgi:hypothetical protein
VVYAVAAFWSLLVGLWVFLTLYRIAVWRTREGSIARTCFIGLVLVLPSQLVILPGGLERAAIEVAVAYAVVLATGIVSLYVERSRKRAQ